MLQNKNTTLILVLGAFVLGFTLFWVLNTLSKPETSPERQNIINALRNTGNERETEQPKISDTPNIPKTKALDLSGQELNKLPEYVLNRRDLEELNISNNNLTGALPSEIGKLTKLKILNASDNQMTGVPAEVGHLPNLEVLDLSNNKLTGLPNELGQLKKLKMLNLSGNDYSKQDLDIIRKGLSPNVKIVL